MYVQFSSTSQMMAMALLVALCKIFSCYSHSLLYCSQSLQRLAGVLCLFFLHMHYSRELHDANCEKLWSSLAMAAHFIRLSISPAHACVDLASPRNFPFAPLPLGFSYQAEKPTTMACLVVLLPVHRLVHCQSAALANRVQLAGLFQALPAVVANSCYAAYLQPFVAVLRRLPKALRGCCARSRWKF